MIPNSSIPTIISAFFDIGRSDWVGPNLPHYLKRTTDEYFTNFERLLKLDNRIIVFTSPDLEERFEKYTEQNRDLIVVALEDYWEPYPVIYEKIKRIQKLPEFKASVQQPYNPEYWSPGYVMINLLKSYFVNYAVDHGLTNSDMVFWCDFGYCRTDSNIMHGPWSYAFDENKIHVFTHRDSVPDRIDVRNIIERNEVYLMGCHIGAPKHMWRLLYREMFDSMKTLIDNDLVDDDQTLLLMSYIKNKELFEVHYIDANDGGWFQLFTKFRN